MPFDLETLLKDVQVKGLFEPFRHRPVRDFHMRLDGSVEKLEGAARIRFAFMRGDAVFSRGTYFVILSEDGRISGLFGFMGQEPNR